MADEDNKNELQKHRPKALLEYLGDLKLGKMFALNLRVFFEPIGVLRFVLIFTTLLAFSLTAGFRGSTDANKATCDTGINTTYTIMMTFYYPYHPPSYTFTYDPAIPSNSSSSCFTSSDRRDFTGSAEYFVALSSFSFVFAILSFPFYFIFYVPRYDLAKYLSIIDLIITCLLVFFYVFAAIAWAAGISQLNSFHEQLLIDKRSMCLIGSICQQTDEAPVPSIQSSVQLSFSVLFGWVSFMLLAASIWFVYKDTIIHQEKMGPLYRLACFGNKSPKHTYEPDAGTYKHTQGDGQEGGAGDVGLPSDS